MKRYDNEAEKARRYSDALVSASLTAGRTAACSGIVASRPGRFVRWQAEPSLWLLAATVQRRAREA